MKIIANARVSSKAKPAAFFDRWADIATWPEWSTDTEWVRLDGPFVEGATGVLKPKGGPKVKFIITKLVPGKEFVDVSKLPGAALTFRHVVTNAGGDTVVEVTIIMSGPCAWFWSRVLGKGLKASIQRDLDNLVAAAEQTR